MSPITQLETIPSTEESVRHLPRYITRILRGLPWPLRHRSRRAKVPPRPFRDKRGRRSCPADAPRWALPTPGNHRGKAREPRPDRLGMPAESHAPTAPPPRRSLDHSHRSLEAPPGSPQRGSPRGTRHGERCARSQLGLRAIGVYRFACSTIASTILPSSKTSLWWAPGATLSVAPGIDDATWRPMVNGITSSASP